MDTKRERHVNHQMRREKTRDTSRDMNKNEYKRARSLDEKFKTTHETRDDAYHYTKTGHRALSVSVPCNSLFVLNKHNRLFDKYTVHSASFLALTSFAMFSSVASLTHTKVPLVCKSIQASCIATAHVDATLVLVRKKLLFYN